MAALIATALGAATILWAAGLRMLDPREIGWVMRGDWQIHFLGWQFFRHEPWQLPPGAVNGLLEPIGTSLGYTDSIPLVAFVLKPFAEWLPNPFQYLGLWFLVCFALQGFFGALVISTWTPRASLQVLGAAFFVFFPTLVSRIAHPALCAHWLILWALWLNWRRRDAGEADYLQHVVLGGLAGLIHPYLAVMTLALLLALALRRGALREVKSLAAAAGPFAAAATAVLVGWWASGLLRLQSAGDVAAEAGRFSMNLLAVFNPGPRAFLLPGFKVVSLDQFGEGFQYFGAGALILCAVAAGIAIARRRFSRASLPLVLVLAACAIYSVLPQISVGTRVVLDLSDSVGGFISVFRSTGRFFWPVGYALLAAAFGMLATEFRPRVATAVLAVTFAVQMVDLHRWWLEMHNGSRGDAFFEWNTPLGSDDWRELLPHYRHVQLYYPAFCRGPAPVATGPIALLASVHGLTLNDGFAARVSPVRQAAACALFAEDFARGFIEDDTVYLLAPALLTDFQTRLGKSVDCRAIDGVGVCTSQTSMSGNPGRRDAGVPPS
jgi:hypothetical protein